MSRATTACWIFALLAVVAVVAPAPRYATATPSSTANPDSTAMPSSTATPSPTATLASAPLRGHDDAHLGNVGTIQYLSGVHAADEALGVEIATADTSELAAIANLTISVDHPAAATVAIAATSVPGQVTIIDGASASAEAESAPITHAITYSLDPEGIDHGTVAVLVTLYAANGDTITAKKRSIAVRRSAGTDPAIHYSGADGHAALALRIFDATWDRPEAPTAEQRRAAASTAAVGAITTEATPGQANNTESDGKRNAQPGMARIEGDIGWFDSIRQVHPYGAASVRLLAADGSLIATTVTAGDGTYAFDVDPGIGLRLQATTEGPGHTVWVPGAVGEIPYAITQGPFDAPADATTTVTIRPGSASPETDWMAVHQALVPGVTAAKLLLPTLSRVDALFPFGSSSYQVDGQLIRIAEADAQDFDVVLHELGHRWGRAVGIDNSPGDAHIIGEDLAARYGKDKGLRLAWSEGFATFFSVAAQHITNLSSLGIPYVGDFSYHDINNAPNIDFGFSLEADPSGAVTPSLGTKGAGDEVAVARALWDAYDGVTATGDTDNDALALGPEVLARLSASSATDLFAGWLAVLAPLDPNIPTDRRTLLAAGCIMSEVGAAPAPIGPLSVEDEAPTFTWEPGGAGEEHKNDQFSFTILNADASLELFTTSTFAPTLTLPDDVWEEIRTNKSFRWSVGGVNRNQPLTLDEVSGCGQELQTLDAVVASTSNDCLAGNGRIRIEITNRTTTPREVTSSVTGLTPRSITIEPRSSRTVTFTGRADGVYRVNVISEGRAIVGTDVTVRCDDDGGIDDGPPTEARIAKSCLGNNGRIDVHLNNLNDRAAEYSVLVDQVPAKINTLASSETRRVSTTGRPDGGRPVRVLRNGSLILQEIVQIACDIDPAGRVVVVLQSCYRGTGRFDVYVTNYTAAAKTYGVTVGLLAERTIAVDPQETVREAVTGRRDGPYRIVVRDGDQIVFESADDYIVSCGEA